MGVLKYDTTMQSRAYVRLTTTQASSLSAMANAMSLTVGDLIRFAIDELIDDVPEPRLFTQSVHLALHHDRR